MRRRNVKFIIISAAYLRYISSIQFCVCIGSLLYECFVTGYSNNPTPLIQYRSDDKIEKNEMGGACSAYGGVEKHIQGFWWANLRERDHLGDPGIHGWITLR